MGQVSKYPAEFREQAVELVRTSGKTISEAARGLGMNDTTLGYWVNADRAERGEPDAHGQVALSRDKRPSS